MTKQNDNTESVEIRLVVTGRPDELKVLAAKWFRSNKFEALDFLAQGKKAEIIAEARGTQNQILGAKVESSAFFSYLVSSLNAQIAVENGVVPDVFPEAAVSAVSSVSLLRPTPPLESEAANGGEDDDDDKVIINLAPGMK